MANYYTQTSFVIKLRSLKEQQWFKENWIGKSFDEDDDPNIIIQLMDNENGRFGEIWLYADEGFGSDQTAALLQKFLKECRPKGRIGFTWANTCSSMRVNEFDGGGLTITAKHVTWHKLNVDTSKN